MSNEYFHQSYTTVSLQSIKAAKKDGRTDGGGAGSIPFTFPSTRAILWDHRETGKSLLVNPCKYRNPVLILEEKTLRLAHRFAENSPSETYNCLFTSSIDVYPDGEGLSISIDQYNSSLENNNADDIPGDLNIPCLVKKNSAKPSSSAEDFSSAFKMLSQRCTSRKRIDISKFLYMQAKCSYHANAQNFILHIDFDLVTLSTEFKMTPINNVPIVQTALSKNLASPLSVSDVQGEAKSGYLTMDQTRKLLLILESDPKVSSLPLVGIWVSGISNVHDPFVWACCLRYIHNSHLKDRVCVPPESFLVLLYSPVQSRPLFFQTTTANGKNNMDFTLSSCHEVIQLPKDSLGRMQSPMELELLKVETGDKLIVFQAALENNIEMLKQNEAKGGNHIMSMDEEDIVPRSIPAPHLTKAPSIRPSVPEVSLLLDDPCNTPPNCQSLDSSYRSPAIYGHHQASPLWNQSMVSTNQIMSKHTPPVLPTHSENLQQHYSPCMQARMQNTKPKKSKTKKSVPQVMQPKQASPVHTNPLVGMYQNSPQEICNPYASNQMYNQQSEQFMHQNPPMQQQFPLNQLQMQQSPFYNTTQPQAMQSNYQFNPSMAAQSELLKHPQIIPQNHQASNMQMAANAQHSNNFPVMSQQSNIPMSYPQYSNIQMQSTPQHVSQSQMSQVQQLDTPMSIPQQTNSPLHTTQHQFIQQQCQQNKQTKPIKKTKKKTRESYPPAAVASGPYGVASPPRVPQSPASPGHNSGDSGLHDSAEHLNDSLNGSPHASNKRQESPQVPSEVYELIRRQDEQLKMLREQISVLLANQNSPSASVKQDMATQSSKPATPMKQLMNSRQDNATQSSRPASPPKTCSQAINTSHFDASPSRLHQPPPPPTSQEHSPAQQQETIMSFGEFNLTQQIQEQSQNNSMVSEMMVDMPAYSSLSPEKCGQGLNGSSSFDPDSPLLGESVSMYEKREVADEELDDSGRGTGEAEDLDLQETSLLYKNHKKFYENLMCNVQKFLKNDTSYSEGSPFNDTIHTVQSDPGPIRQEEKHVSQYSRLSHQEVDIAQKTKQQLIEMGIPISTEETFIEKRPATDKSYRYDQSYFFDSAMLPKISYVSMMLDRDTDTSADVDALAMKYLTDGQLSELAKLRLSSPMKGAAAGRLDRVVGAGNDTDISRVGVGNHLSFASRKYLQRYGLIDSEQSGDGVNNAAQLAQHKMKSNNGDFTNQRINGWLMNNEGDGDILESNQVDQQKSFQKQQARETSSTHQMKSDKNEIKKGQNTERVLDIERLRELPKLL